MEVTIFTQCIKLGRSVDTQVSVKHEDSGLEFERPTHTNPHTDHNS